MNGKREQMNLRNYKKLALDTNIFVYFFEENFQFVQFVKPIFDRLSDDKMEAVTSTISLTEALSSKKLSYAGIKVLKGAFLSVPNLTILDVNQEISIEAASIRRMLGFRLGDAIQLATARFSRAKAFITNDQRLKAYKKVKVILISELKG